MAVRSFRLGTWTDAMVRLATLQLVCDLAGFLIGLFWFSLHYHGRGRYHGQTAVFGTNGNEISPGTNFS